MATLTSAGAKLPSIPMVERLSPSVVRVLGGNGGKFTLQGTNTHLLGTSPDSLILLDTAQGFPQWREHLSSYLQKNNLKIKTCILTHWHGDHVLGVPDLMEISPETRLYKNQGKKLDPDGVLADFVVDDISNGQTFSDGAGFEIEAVHCPGHTKDHMAFIITKSKHNEEIGRMFTGDNVLGHGTAVFEDLAVYLRSLAVMKNRIQTEISSNSNITDKSNTNSIKAYPSHGIVIDNIFGKIEEYVKHRKTREDEALNVLTHGSVKVPSPSPGAASQESKTKKIEDWHSMQIVRVIYKDVPENLHQPAERGLLMILEKLKGEGKVIKTEGGRWRIVASGNTGGGSVNDGGKSTL